MRLLAAVHEEAGPSVQEPLRRVRQDDSFFSSIRSCMFPFFHFILSGLSQNSVPKNLKYIRWPVHSFRKKRVLPVSAGILLRLQRCVVPGTVHAFTYSMIHNFSGCTDSPSVGFLRRRESGGLSGCAVPGQGFA